MIFAMSVLLYGLFFNNFGHLNCNCITIRLLSDCIGRIVPKLNMTKLRPTYAL